MIYIISNFLIVILLGVFLGAYKNDNRYTKNFMYISFLMLVVLHSIVDAESMPDLPSYLLAFQDVRHYKITELQNSFWADSFELGYMVFMKIVSYVTSNFNIFLAISSIIWLSAYYSAIRKYSPYIFVSIVLFLVTIYDQSIFVLRQHLAMAILVLSWDSIIKKEPIKFACFCGVAFTLHVSAIVFAPLYILYQIRDHRKYIMSILAACVVFASSYFVILEYIGSSVMDNASTYLYNIKYEGSNYNEAIMMTILMSSMIFFMRKHVFEDGMNRLLFSFMCIGLVGSFFGVGNSATGRLFAYFTAIPYMMVPVVMTYIKDKPVKVIYATGIIALYAFVAYVGSQSHNFDNMKLISMF